MVPELAATVNLVAAWLYNKLPRRRVDAFAEELESRIKSKLQGHWYPDNPSRAAAQRCLVVSGEKPDPIIPYSIVSSGLDIDEVSSYLPKELTIWIDPGEVSFTLGDKTQVRILYSAKRNVNNQDDVITTPLPNNASNQSSTVSSPDNELNNLGSVFGSMNLVSSSVTNSTATWSQTQNMSPWTSLNNNNPWANNNNNQQQKAAAWTTNHSMQQMAPNSYNPFTANQIRNTGTGNKTMTAAMFAQTKFGSTKLKSHSKRSSRLSPTDSINFNKQFYPPGPQFGYGMVANRNTNGYNGTNMTPSIERSTQPPNGFNQFEFQLDDLTNGSAILTQPKYKPQNQAIGSHRGNVERVSPSSLGSMTSNDANDWVDLSDMAVFPSNGSTILAT